MNIKYCLYFKSLQNISLYNLSNKFFKYLKHNQNTIYRNKSLLSFKIKINPEPLL